MVFKSFSALICSCALLLCVCPTVHAEPEILNGSLTGPVSSSDSGDATAPPGWYVANSTPNVVYVDGPFNNTGVLWTLSPDGGTYSRLNGPGNPVHSEAIGQAVDGFNVGTIYSLNFFQVNHGFYNDKFGDWGYHEGYIALFVDDVLVGQSSPITGPTNYTDETVWHSASISFTATSTSHTIVLQAFTTEPTSDPYAYEKIAYMGIDGVRITSEVCNNGVDDDGDGLVDADDPDCAIAEICNNGIDDDLDGDTDAADVDCAVIVPEICDNGIDDDFDGLTDWMDPDCAPLGLLVRCMHSPLYPQAGEQVTVTAQAIDRDGNSVVPDSSEIYINNLSPPAVSVSNSDASINYTPSGGSFSYGCRATYGSEIAKSWDPVDQKLRSVDVGEVNNPTWKAIPVIYNGAIDNKIDIVFFPDKNDYTSYDHPDFLNDVSDLIYEGIFTIPWFVLFQYEFNFWIAMDNTSESGPLLSPPGTPPPTSSTSCKRIITEDFEDNYSWSQGAGIVHTTPCRDNASSGVFTTEMDNNRLQVVAHEIGHAAFGLADEYCCDGGYFTSKKPFLSSNYKPPFPNLFETLEKCQDDSPNRPYSGGACREIKNTTTSTGWWIGEPDYRAGIPKLSQVPDFMQQTGGIDILGVIYDRYKVGNSERDRMFWLTTECNGGEC